MLGKVWIAFLVLAASTVRIAIPQTTKPGREPTSGWTYPVIEDYGRAWPLPYAAVQPQPERTYKVVFSLSNPAPNPNEVLDGLAHVARLFNVFAADGVPPKNLKVVAIFHGSAGYAAMDNGAYRAKFNVENPNLKIIHELKTAGVRLLLCGQTLHDLNLSEQGLLPDIRLATSAAIVLVTYQNDGYALMPF